MLALAASLALCAPGARAEEGRSHVENRCPRLSVAEYDELDARVLLLLKGEPRGRALPVVVCTAAGAYVEWSGQRYEIVGRASLVDEVVDLVDGVLHGDARGVDARPRRAEAGAVAAGGPTLERSEAPAAAPPQRERADPIALQAKDARGGGVSLAMQLDVPSRSIGPALGPVFDFATSVGPLLLGGREAIRFTTRPSQRLLSFMDLQGSIAYGAPFNPDRSWGVVTRFGAQWMVAYPDGNSSQASVVPIFDVGLRAAHAFGFVSVWLGFDVHFRLERLRLRSLGDEQSAEVSPSLTLGVAFVDWSRK